MDGWSLVSSIESSIIKWVTKTHMVALEAEALLGVFLELEFLEAESLEVKSPVERLSLELSMLEI